MEEALDLSFDRLRMMMMMTYIYIHTYIHSSRVFRKAGMTLFLFVEVHNVILILGHDDKRVVTIGLWDALVNTSILRRSNISVSLCTMCPTVRSLIMSLMTPVAWV